MEKNRWKQNQGLVMNILRLSPFNQALCNEHGESQELIQEGYKDWFNQADYIDFIWNSLIVAFWSEKKINI